MSIKVQESCIFSSYLTGNIYIYIYIWSFDTERLKSVSANVTFGTKPYSISREQLITLVTSTSVCYITFTSHLDMVTTDD